jgi:hypothetical protein
MARGYPDFTNPSYAIASKLIDTGATLLALGAPLDLDGLGRVFILDSWQFSLSSWIIGLAGDGANPAVSALESQHGGVSLAFPAGTLAGAGISLAYQYFYLGVPLAMGVQFSVRVEPATPDYYVRLTYSLGGPSPRGQVKVDGVTGDVSVLTAAGWVFITSVGVTAASEFWVDIKLTIDPLTGFYKRLVVGQVLYDISLLDIPAVVDASTGRVQVILECDGNIAAATIGYIGYIMLTLDEP